MINQAIHYVDLLAWIMGGVQSVSGAYDNFTHQDVIETEDTAVAICRFKRGALGTIEATSSSHLSWEPEISITGVEGTVDIRGKKVVRTAFADEELEKELCKQLDEGHTTTGVITGKEYYGEGHRAQIGDFINSVANGRSPFVTVESARHAVDIVLGLYESHCSGKWVSLD